MKSSAFILLAPGDWKETRETLIKYCRLVGAIREALCLPLRHSLHTNLLICSKGFTTSSIQKNIFLPGHTFEVIIDLVNMRLRIESNFREPLFIALTGQSLNALCDETCSLLTDLGITVPLEKPSFLDGLRGRFDIEPINNYWKTVEMVAELLREIKKKLLGETSDVQLRPDDLSLNLSWFGNKISAKNSRRVEQVEFGFSTGDDIVQELYFYVSAFPEMEILKEFYNDNAIIHANRNLELAILPFKKLIEHPSPEDQILSFYKSIYLIYNPS